MTLEPTRTKGAVIFPQLLGGAIDFLGAFEFDVTTEVELTRTVRWTDHPTEDGTTVTDHAFDEPARMTLNGQVSNTPVGNPLDRLETSRLFSKASNLDILLQEHGLLTVCTGLEVVENMGMTSVRRRQRSGGANWFELTLALREVQISDLRFASIPARARPAKAGGLGKEVPQGPAADPTADAISAEVSDYMETGRAGFEP